MKNEEKIGESVKEGLSSFGFVVRSERVPGTGIGVIGEDGTKVEKSSCKRREAREGAVILSKNLMKSKVMEEEMNNKEDVLTDFGKELGG